MTIRRIMLFLSAASASVALFALFETLLYGFWMLALFPGMVLFGNVALFLTWMQYES